MTPQAAFKTITATIAINDIRSFDPEIHDLLSGNHDPVTVANYLKRRYGNSGNLEVRVADNKIELKWIAGSANPQAEQHHQEALAFARQKDFPKAIAKWTQAVALNSGDPDYYFNLGLAFFESKNYKEAVENLSQTLTVCPIYHRAHLILGTLLLKMRKYVEAETHLRESTLFNSRNALAHLNLGAVYSILKKYQEGISSFQRAIELAPGEIRAYFGLAKIHSILGDTENANLNYRKVIELDKAGALANHAKRAIITTTETVVPQADLEKLYAEAYKAFLYSDFKTAAAYYQRYLERKGDDDQVWAMMGSALLRAGATERALEAFERASKLKPSKGLYFKQLGVAYDLLDRAEAAAHAFSQAHDLGKADSVLLAAWGKNLIKLNQITEALTHLERAVKMNRANLLAQYYLAVALMRMGQADRAVAHFEAVIGAKVSTPLKAEAQAQFRKLRG